MKLVNNFIKNTTPKGAQQNDPFWERSEIALDTALILYLIHEAPPEEQNFEMLIYMIENGGAKEDDDDYQRCGTHRKGDVRAIRQENGGPKPAVFQSSYSGMGTPLHN